MPSPASVVQGSALTALLLLLLSVLGAVEGSMSDYLSWGYCQDPQAPPDYNINNFTGTWYTLMWLENKFVKVKSCLVSNYTLIDGELYRVDGALTGENKIHYKLVDLKLDEYNDAMFTLPPRALRPTVNVHVIDTDYKTYACLYACGQTFGLKVEVGIVLSRTPSMSQELYDYCFDAIDDVSDGVSEKLSVMSQGPQCPYWKYYQESEPEEMFDNLNPMLKSYEGKVFKPDVFFDEMLEDLMMEEAAIRSGQSQGQHSHGAVVLGCCAALLAIVGHWL